MIRDNRGIGRKVAVGTAWTVAMRLGVRGLSVVSTLVLARLLVPEDFGIIAKASLIYEMLVLVTSLGLDSALIANQEAGKRHYDTVWTIHILRGCAIAVALLVLAKPTAQFLNEMALVAVIPAFALAAFLESAVNVGTVDFRKHFKFHLDFRYMMYRRVVAFAVTIGAALLWRNYWAFVAGTISGAITGLLSSFWLSRFRPALSLAEWRSLFRFSRFMLLAELVGAFSTKVDGLILSRFSTTTVFGGYSVAGQVALAPSTELAMPVARALTPGLATLARDKSAFNTLYAETLALVLFFSVPAALGVAAIAEPLVLALLGAKWAQTIPLIGALAFSGIARSFGSISVSAMLAKGLADVHFRVRLIGLFTRTTLLGCGFLWGGVVGLCWGLVASGLLLATISLWIQQRLGMISLRQLFTLVYRTLFSAIIMWGAVSWMDGLFSDLHSIKRLLVDVAFGLSVFVVLSYGAWHLQGRPVGPEGRVFEAVLKRHSEAK